MASDLRRGRIRDDHDTWAVVEAGRVVVGVAVGRRAAAMDGLNVGSTDDRAVAALGRLDWRRWAAHEHSWLVDFRLSEAPRRREVPLLAGGQAGNDLIFILTL